MGLGCGPASLGGRAATGGRPLPPASWMDLEGGRQTCCLPGQPHSVRGKSSFILFCFVSAFFLQIPRYVVSNSWTRDRTRRPHREAWRLCPLEPPGNSRPLPSRTEGSPVRWFMALCVVFTLCSDDKTFVKSKALRDGERLRSCPTPYQSRHCWPYSAVCCFY